LLRRHRGLRGRPDLLLDVHERAPRHFLQRLQPAAVGADSAGNARPQADAAGFTPARRSTPAGHVPAGRPAPPMSGSTTECLKCHTPLPDGSKFCYACGADVTGAGTMGASSGIEGLQARLQRLVEGKYKVERMLGKGGMGAVFLAHDLTLE